MSVADVTSRIAEIRGQISSLAPVRPLTAAATATAARGAAFSTALQSASAGLLTTGGGAGEATSAQGEAVVAEAKKYLGLPYVWGGTDPTKGLDCSGLVQLVYKNLGHDLPRVSNQQASAGRPVASMAEAQPGDLIAWDNSSRNRGVDHIAIYIGGGKMIEAPRTGLDIRIIDVPSTPDVIRRIIPDATSRTSAGAFAASSASAASRATSPQLTLGQMLGQNGQVAGLWGTVPTTATQPSGVTLSGQSGQTGTPYADLFASAGARHGVSPELLAAVAKQESGFNPRAVSPAGAQGLMQLMPATAKGLDVTDSFDPAQAVDGAAKLLRTLLDRFGSTDLALAAYNAGPGAVIRYNGVPPYQETQNYVRSITTSLGGNR